jgi:membrane-bound ClpP family serine protease
MKQTLKNFTLAGTIVALIPLLTAMPAQAYVGPGAGLSLLSALWAVIAAVAVAIGFVLMWPIRKMIRNKRRKNAATSTTAHANTASTTKSD